MSKLLLRKAKEVHSGKEEKQPPPLYRTDLLMQTDPGRLMGPVKHFLFPLRTVLRLGSQMFLHYPISDLAAWLPTSFPDLWSWEPELEPLVQNHSSLLVCLQFHVISALNLQEPCFQSSLNKDINTHINKCRGSHYCISTS